MPDTALPAPLTPVTPSDRQFPTLTPAQLARMAAQGSVRQVRRGEVLVDVGDQISRFFVVTTARIDIVRPSDDGEEIIVVIGPGQFTGEVSALSGRRSFVRLRVASDGDVIEINHDHLMTLVQTDSELSDILMRAFILRRVELIARGAGDVVLVGSDHCAGTL